MRIAGERDESKFMNLERKSGELKRVKKEKHLDSSAREK